VPLSGADLSILAAAAAAGAALQAATGFGFAIVAAPVFLTVLESTASIPILVALHVVQSAALVPRIWNGIPWRDFWHLATGALIGCPAGLLLFRMLAVRELKLGVGIVILFVTCVVAWRQMGRAPTATPARHDHSAREQVWSRAITGALSGALTALIVMPGPPLMVSLLRNPMPAASARALSIGFFAACYLVVLAVQWGAGEFDAEARSTILWLAVPVLAGTGLGHYGARWLNDRHLERAMIVLLLLAGAGAIASAL